MLQPADFNCVYSEQIGLVSPWCGACVGCSSTLIIILPETNKKKWFLNTEKKAKFDFILLFKFFYS